jgi:hypothetical protein
LPWPSNVASPEKWHSATIKRGLAMATALGNDCIICSPAPAGKNALARKMAPVKAAKQRLEAASNNTQVVVRIGLPTAMHRTMDENDKDVDIATAITAPASMFLSARKMGPGRAA